MHSIVPVDRASQESVRLIDPSYRFRAAFAFPGDGLPSADGGPPRSCGIMGMLPGSTTPYFE
jgi:hypothetical protein